MCPFDKCFSIAHIRHRLHCVHLPKYHRVVSINRPSGYEPDALPLRHDDGLSLGSFDLPPPARIRPEMLPLHYNDLVDICPSVAYIRHRLHYVPINHINNFFIITIINHLNDF